MIEFFDSVFSIFKTIQDFLMSVFDNVASAVSFINNNINIFPSQFTTILLSLLAIATGVFLVRFLK